MNLTNYPLFYLPMYVPCMEQAVASASRAPNAVDVLKSVGVHHLEPELAETVMSLRAYE